MIEAVLDRGTELLNCQLISERYQADSREVGWHPHHSDQAGSGPGMAEEDGRRAEDQRPRQGPHAPVV